MVNRTILNLAPYYAGMVAGEHLKVKRCVKDFGDGVATYEFKIPNKNGDFVLRVDKELELCSMQCNGSSGRWMKEDLKRLKALLNSCNFI